MEHVTRADSLPPEDRYAHLEQGRILYFPATPFKLSEPEREVMRKTGLTGGTLHKNIAYRPGEDKVTGIASDGGVDQEKVREVMRAYSERALEFLRGYLPRYMRDCRVDFASFRPLEEEGRDLPTKKRNDLLHVDAFPTRPTHGDLILRFFTNINATQPRVWVTGDPFAPVAERYAIGAGLSDIARNPRGSVVDRLVHKRSAYDRFMLGFHDYLKFNNDYQEGCPKYRTEFPPDATWMVFTDIVPHAVMSGRFALEQTVIVKRSSLASPDRAPIAILEQLCQKPLA